MPSDVREHIYRTGQPIRIYKTPGKLVRGVPLVKFLFDRIALSPHICQVDCILLLGRILAIHDHPLLRHALGLGYIVGICRHVPDAVEY
jgi:hypothetical protein